MIVTPALDLFSGDGTSASPTASQLEQDASAVQPYVSGFWMNIPDRDNAMAEQVMIAEAPELAAKLAEGA
jgi:hypothetical protein